MQPMGPGNQILTKNDQGVLRSVLDQARLPDTEMARKMNLPRQEIYKIRTKLESKGIIDGYMLPINFKRLRINVCPILAIKVKSTVWEKLSEEQVNKGIVVDDYLIEVRR
jgi:DNA-binding Lrp family transcriptional regulator